MCTNVLPSSSMKIWDQSIRGFPSYDRISKQTNIDFYFIYVYLYIYFTCLSVCLFVCLYPINVKKAKPIGPKFLWDLAWPQGRFMNDQNFKHLCLKFFIFENARKKFSKLANFFLILYKEKILKDKATIKSWNRRWARSNLIA